MSARERLRSRAGQSLPEYAILLALVAAGLVILLLGFGANVQTIYTAANHALSVASGSASGGSGSTPSGTSAGGGGVGGSGAGVGGVSGTGSGAPGAGGGASAAGGGGPGGTEPTPGVRPQ
jgi:Flp pilus assembly pilin Flp